MCSIWEAFKKMQIKKRCKLKKIYILCANDRFNYGDLLFPFILEEYLKDVVDEFVICSTTESDLSARGALPTMGYEVLEALSPENKNILIIGGGECLYARWSDILGYVSKDSYEYHKFPTKYPFTIDKSELENLDCVLYNSIGCHQLYECPDSFIKKDLSILNSADYISVRDTPSSLGIRGYGIKHYKCADSAILMSKLFDIGYLKNKSSNFINDIISKKYIFFQIGLIHVKGRAKEYAQILNEVIKETGIQVCMCPIGTAIGHEDDVALLEIAEYLTPGTFIMIEEPSVWEIMNLISNAEIYVGTSLHGAITAMSYKVPLIAHGPRKLQVYIETWYDTIGTEYSFVSIDNLKKAVLRRLRTRFMISPKQQFASVEESFNRIKKIIKRR